MSIFSKIKNFFRKGGEKLGMINGLNLITDDPRIGIPASEYTRIKKARDYYQNKFPKVKYRTWEGITKSRKFQPINVTKIASRRLASLIFNEQCSVKVNDESLQDILNEVFAETNFYLDFETNLEKWIALGSGAVRPYIDEDKIKLSWSDAMDVYPLNANTTHVNEIALTRKLMKIENKITVYYTLLEFHQWDGSNKYVITNELYRSENENVVGVRVPLNSIEEFKDIEPTTTLENLEKPLFAFYKNAGANNKSLISPMGLGICDNSWPTVDAINTTHDEFIWEVKTGKRRITVPKHWLKRPENRNGQPLSPQEQMIFDPNDAVFLPFNSPQGEGFQDLSINIRVDQYTQTMQYFLGEFENQIGLSQGTFTTTPSGIQTATEVVTNNSMTYQTRSSYLTMTEKAIKALVYAIAELLQIDELWSTGAKWSGDLDKLDIDIDFNDGVFVDQNSQRQSDLQAVTAGIMPYREFLKRNYGLDDDEVTKWLKEKQDETIPPEPDFEQFNPNVKIKSGDEDESRSDDESS